MPYAEWTMEQLVQELHARDSAPVEVAKSINLLETIHLAQTDFLTVDSETNIFHRMLENFLEVTGCEYGFIDELFESEDGSRYLEARAITNIAWDEGSRALYEKLVSGEIRFDNLKSLYGVALISGEPVIANDAPTDPRRTGVPPGHPALNSFLGYPLYAAGEYVGMLGLANAPGGFSKATLKRLEPLTRICGIMMLSLKIDRRRAEAIDGLERLTAQLRASNEELQTFAYVASHDLQTPLRSISGFVQLLRTDYGDQLDERAQGWIQHTVDATDRLQLLIADLLAYARLGADQAEFAATPLADVLAEVEVSLDAPIREAGAAVSHDTLPTVVGDRGQLLQLMQNLVGNGLKYRAAEPPKIHVFAEHNADQWTIGVRDNGIGIAEKHQDRVFEVFRRLHTQRQFPGTGVGLAVCRRVVRRHGGRIWVESRPGEGSTFFFTLPGQPGEGGSGHD